MRSINQERYEKQRTEEVSKQLLTTSNIKDDYGQWHNYIPEYKQRIVAKIKDWTDSEEISKQAKKEGWFSLTGKVGYSNYTIPDRPCESLVGYLNIVLLRQYFLNYGIMGGNCSSLGKGAIIPEVKQWLRSNAFRDQILRDFAEPTIIYRPEHLKMIRGETL